MAGLVRLVPAIHALPWIGIQIVDARHESLPRT
jgi:hypothetical protein